MMMAVAHSDRRALARLLCPCYATERERESNKRMTAGNKEQAVQNKQNVVTKRKQDTDTKKIRFCIRVRLSVQGEHVTLGKC